MIDRLQRLLGIDLRYYMAGGGYLIFSQLAPLALLFISTWFLTNYLPKSAYGAYSYVQSLLGMLIVFTLPGYYNAVFRSVARGKEGALLVSVKRRLLFSIIGSLIVAGIGLYYLYIGDTNRAAGCLAATLFFGLALGLDDFRAFLNGKKNYKAFAAYHVGLQLVVTIITVGVLLLTGEFLFTLIANLAVRGFGQLLVVLLVAKGRQNDLMEEDFYQFGNKLSVYSALGSVSAQLDRVLVGSFFALTLMADYNLAVVLTNPLRTIGVTLNRLIFPKMVNLKGRAFALKTLHKGLMIIAGLVVIGGVYYLVLPYVLLWLFPDYTGIRSFANWLMVAELVAVLVIYLETYYLSQDEFHKTYYQMNFARPLAMIILLPVMLWQWGIMGAIWTKIIIRGIEAVYLMTRIALDWDDHSSGNDAPQ